jgi:transcription elongation factor Elf1
VRTLEQIYHESEEPMKDDELLPCPFCGGKPCVVASYGAREFVLCGWCSASVEKDRNAGCVEKWNRRIK